MMKPLKIFFFFKKEMFYAMSGVVLQLIAPDNKRGQIISCIQIRLLLAHDN